jgi:hypothetical protein
VSHPGHDQAVATLGVCPDCAAADIAEGTAARDQALAAVADAAPDQWVADAKAAVRWLAATGAEFTTDQVWARVQGAPPEPRAMGAVMRWAAEQHLVVRTGRSVPSTRPERHAGPCAVWAPTPRP